MSYIKASTVSRELQEPEGVPVIIRRQSTKWRTSTRNPCTPHWSLPPPSFPLRESMVAFSCAPLSIERPFLPTFQCIKTVLTWIPPLPPSPLLLLLRSASYLFEIRCLKDILASSHNCLLSSPVMSHFASLLSSSTFNHSAAIEMTSSLCLTFFPTFFQSPPHTPPLKY
ncbi:hypothetical protein FRB91_008433 [Serendipita sp. 411]|nr:hypothetical protein FRB91_008433 [Serendipita sp. 411]